MNYFFFQLFQFPIDTKNAAWFEIVANPGTANKFYVGALLAVGKSVSSLAPHKLSTEKGEIQAESGTEHWYTATANTGTVDRDTKIEIIKKADAEVIGWTSIINAINACDGLVPKDPNKYPLSHVFTGPVAEVSWSKEATDLNKVDPNLTYSMEHNGESYGMTIIQDGQTLKNVYLSRDKEQATRNVWLPKNVPVKLERSDAFRPKSVYIDYKPA